MPDRSKVKDATVRMAKYCAYQERSAKEINAKLIELELSQLEEEEVWAYLKKEKYHDEERYVRAIVRGRFNYKSWGKVKLRYYLSKQDISTDLIDRIFDEEIDIKDYTRKVNELVRSKIGLKEKLAFEDKQKIIRSLYQKGFESEIVIDQLNQLIN